MFVHDVPDLLGQAMMSITAQKNNVVSCLLNRWNDYKATIQALRIWREGAAVKKALDSHTMCWDLVCHSPHWFCNSRVGLRSCPLQFQM